MKIRIAVTLLVGLMFSNSLWAEINFYIESVVDDSRAYEKKIDHWMSSKDGADAGYQLTIFSVLSNGYNPATHVTVIRVGDYAGIDKMIGVNESSEDWQYLQKDLASIRARHTEGHSEEVVTHGKQDWEKGDVFAAVAMNIKDFGSYLEAFEKFQKSRPGKEAPGMVRLMRTLEGGTVSHYVLISGSSFAALNNYLDSMRGSSEFADFEQSVADNRKVVGVRYIRVDRVWDS